MLNKEKYGVVYTPTELSEFVSKLIIDELDKEIKKDILVLDPACGEGSLLKAMSEELNGKCDCIGIDIDEKTIEKNKTVDNIKINYIVDDFIVPGGEKSIGFRHWRKKIKDISVVIANPPWSTERFYNKRQLKDMGYEFVDGQYDNYILFIEACIKLVKEKGICAFIIPDSIFAYENRSIRKMMCENVSIKVIARLGEKLFDGVNRATTVIILKKDKPTIDSVTKCFRLTTIDRKNCLEKRTKFYDCYQSSFHIVKQKRFSETKEYLFDIDVMEEDEKLLKKMEINKIDWSVIFQFGRGVEISKSGEVVVCPKCNIAQGFSKKQLNAQLKRCSHCGNDIIFTEQDIQCIISGEKQKGQKKIYVGENLHRYAINGCRYINMNVTGINYKNPSIYIPPKILVRKTGLGINAYLDYDSTFISQTIYSCQYTDKDNNVPMEYYLAILNSRVVFYYYIKTYGENEWKSHPYFTKDILFSLPVRKYVKNDLTLNISKLSRKITKCYSRDLDLKLEDMIMDLYELSEEERIRIKEEMNRLPNLGAINNMKF